MIIYKKMHNCIFFLQNKFKEISIGDNYVEKARL